MQLIQTVYFVLVAAHIVAIVVTGIMWATIDIVPGTGLRAHLRDIRAVHFGSLYLVPWLLGLTWAFHHLDVPWWHQVFFPAGLGLLVFFSGLGYMFPKPKDLDPFYYWTRGWGLALSLVGLACLITGLLWTAGALVYYSLAR
jgi:hypothetical protein